MKRYGIIFFLLMANHVMSQRLSQLSYIEKYKEIAMEEMKRSGVPAAITLAQAVLESESGNSELATMANNHFGIKCKKEWQGATMYHDDDEKGECFRKYNSAEESFKDHSDFLKFRPYYTSLFQLDPADYKAWAYGLKKAGYATSKDYPAHLMDIIERYDLNRYTMEVINGTAQIQP